MALFPELLLVAGLMSAFHNLDTPTNSAIEEPIAEVLEDIVENYQESKTLYELISQFPVDESIVCPDSDTRLPYPGDCTRYITCRDFKAHIRGCPPGFKFDQESLHCKWGFQVNCTDSENSDRKCGVNEVFSECGPTCERSCEETEDEYLECPEVCATGCFCKPGFIRGPLRNCIPPRKCKASNMLEPWFLINARKKQQETDE